MSLINKMLRDLDKRHAPQGGIAGGSPGLAQHVRPVTGRASGSELFWGTLAVLMLVAVGWAGWVVWQMMPRPVATELAYQSARGKIDAQKASTPANPPVATVAAATVSAPVPQPAATQTGVSAARPMAPVSATEAPKIDMLRLATELTTPIPPSRPRGGTRKGSKLAAADPVQAQRAVTASHPGKIDRRVSSSTEEQAEIEFRRAVGLVNQGRVAEGVDGLKKTLAIDPKHESARLTLVALLLEGKRTDEAAAALREGLALNARNTGFAMLLARVMVEHNDAAGALDLLQKHSAAPDANPDFHAFAAALYQRLNRQKEAIEQYQQALRLAPSTGTWWAGLGISFAAVDRTADAVAAFKNAKSAGNLTPALAAYVEQRLRQLQ